jgi:two-component system, chemotaxis family, protein-glutamate methylesterase/glutaminase
MFARDLIVVGTSAGGVEALQVIARALPGDLAAAVLIVMHTSPEGPSLLPDILGKVAALDVAMAVDAAPLEHGRIYVAPPGHHLLVKGNHIRLSRGPKENRSRPAIDPLFRTAAAAYGPHVVGVILTGMLDDGTAGLAAVKECGGTLVVQAPEEALYPSMPTSALQHVGADFVLPLAEIAPLLARLVAQPMKTRENLPVSRLIEIESKFVEMEAMSVDDMDAIGSHAGFSCPECHGPIWKIKDGTLQRYRCHVGHAYTAHAMMVGQIEAQETHLWQALRLMKERVSLIRELGSPTQGRNRPKVGDPYEAELRRLEKNIASIQEMIAEGDPASGGPTSAGPHA